MTDDERTAYVGNLDEKVTEELLHELFLQAGPLEGVTLPVEKSTGRIKGFAFVCFTHDISVPYAIDLLDGIALYNKSLRVQPRNARHVQKYKGPVGVHYIEDPRQDPASLSGAAVIPPPSLLGYGINVPSSSSLQPPFALYTQQNHGCGYNFNRSPPNAIDNNIMQSFKSRINNARKPESGKTQGAVPQNRGPRQRLAEEDTAYNSEMLQQLQHKQGLLPQVSQRYVDVSMLPSPSHRNSSRHRQHNHDKRHRHHDHNRSVYNHTDYPESRYTPYNSHSRRY